MMRLRNGLLQLFLALASVGAPRVARADSASGYGCMICGNWLPLGASTGATANIKDSDTAFFLGGEVSFLHIPQKRMMWGGYADTIYDFAVHRTRMSLGPEVIFPAAAWVGGFDLGPVVEVGGEKARVGGRVRAFVPIVFVTPYVGLTVIGADASVSAQLGVLLKLPIPLSS